MSHNVKSMDKVISLEKTWHGLESIVSAIDFSNSGLDWLVAERPVIAKVGVNEIEIPGYKALIRQDNNYPISVAKDTYEVIQNERVWEALESGFAGIPYTVETVGTLGNLRKLFISIKLDGHEDYKAGQDQYRNRIIFCSSHDGSMNFYAYDSAIRVVCENTLNYSLNSYHAFKLKVRHTRNAEIKIIDMENEIQNLLKDRREFFTNLQRLQSQIVSQKDATKIILGAIGNDKVLSTRAANRSLDIYNKFLSGKGNKGKTLYDLLNGFTESFTHGASANGKAFSSSEFGSAASKKAQFYASLLSDEAINKLADKGEELIKNGKDRKEKAELALSEMAI